MVPAFHIRANSTNVESGIDSAWAVLAEAHTAIIRKAGDDVNRSPEWFCLKTPYPQRLASRKPTAEGTSAATGVFKQNLEHPRSGLLDHQSAVACNLEFDLDGPLLLIQ